MAYDGWLKFGDTELVNLSRTAQLAATLGIDTLWFTPESTAWIEEALDGQEYDDITEAPWYDPSYLPSTEFAGLVVMSAPGLDDSTRASEVIEYVTDGGNLGLSRSATLPIVFSVNIIASTDRGAEYGKRWMDRVLRGGTSARKFCVGSTLTYLRFPNRIDSPRAHRRDVGLTRASTVTRKRSSDCAVTWTVSFTMTAADSYEYGEPEDRITGLGGLTPTGPEILSSGSVALVEEPCPVFDYTPVFDPEYPALIEPPLPPDFYPDGWNLEEGATFTRFWARVPPLSPHTLGAVPVFTLTTGAAARMVRVSIWPSENSPEDQCGALFTAILTYLPSGYQFVIDGEQRVTYVWDGASPLVRRTDTLVWGPDARPLDWTTLTDSSNLLVSLDIFSESGEIEGEGQVRASLELVSKSD